MKVLSGVPYALLLVAQAHFAYGVESQTPQGCLTVYLEHALVEMQQEHMLALEEVPTVQLVLKHEGWAAHPIVLRAVAEEAHSHGATSAEEIKQFLEHFAGLSENQQKRVSQGVVSRIQELVGVTDHPAAFKHVGPLAKRLGMTESEYRTFVEEWRRAVGANTDEARQVVQMMLTGRSQTFAQGVVDSLPPRKWTFLGLKRDVMTKGTGEPLEIKIKVVTEAEPRALPEHVSAEDRLVPQIQKIKNDKEFEKVWKSIPAANKVAPKLVQKSDFLGTFEHVVAKATSDKTEQEAVMKLLREEANAKSLEFVQVDLSDGPRTFKMGSHAGEEGRYKDEIQRIVTLTKSFEMQKTQFTQLEWALVMGENPSKFTQHGKKILIGGKEIVVDLNRPVENVSWQDVQKFIQKMSKLDPNYEYRLPTEAEWEFMARGGTETAYPHGDSAAELRRNAWFSENSGGTTEEVAHFKPNPYGLYDMHGNVWEWTEDWFEANPERMATNPQGPNSGSYRVLRGGSWYYSPANLRSALRNYDDPALRYSDVGFRLVRQCRP